MRQRVVRVVPLGVIVLAVVFAAAPARADSLLIRGGMLIDGTGGPPLPNARILIEDSRIKDVWAAGAPGKREPPDARVVDAAGKFIIPGLVDSHVHYREYMGELFLSHGITSVFDLGDPYYWLRAVRHALNDGGAHGPRFYFCGGPLLSAEAEADLPSISRRGEEFGVIRKPEEAPGIIRAVKEKSDCLKLDESFPGELFAPLAREARASGLAVISHSFQAVDSARWGITGVEHMIGVALATIHAPAGKQAVAGMHMAAGHKNSFAYQWMEPQYFDEVIRELIDRGAYINPTLAFEWKAISDRAASQEAEDLRLFHRPDLQHLPLDERLLSLGQYHWPDDRPQTDRAQFLKGYRNVQEFLRRFVKAGGKIYAGTDTAAATTPGLSLHHEMELLVDAGLSPMQAIVAASKAGADLLGLDRDLGSVQPGRLADLVVLGRDPLQDIRNSKTIETVIKGGRIIDLQYKAAHLLPIPHPGPITKHLYNPAPRVRDVTPPVATEGGGTTVRVKGRGFIATSVAALDKVVLPTRVINGTELEVQLPATLEAGAFYVTVQNPKPGGGDSNAVLFLVSKR